jgi:NAD(P)-dependent dehydrogenase (short-subunit alcohol dehydrogenase family)
MARLAGKVEFIAGGGIGRATAERFASHHHRPDPFGR